MCSSVVIHKVFWTVFCCISNIYINIKISEWVVKMCSFWWAPYFIWRGFFFPIERDPGPSFWNPKITFKACHHVALSGVLSKLLLVHESWLSLLSGCCQNASILDLEIAVRKRAKWWIVVEFWGDILAFEFFNKWSAHTHSAFSKVGHNQDRSIYTSHKQCSSACYVSHSAKLLKTAKLQHRSMFFLLNGSTDKLLATTLASVDTF